VLQLLARLYGTNNVNNCSYYCHRATGVGLQNATGSRRWTISPKNLGKSDRNFVDQAQTRSSNHPRFVASIKKIAASAAGK